VLVGALNASVFCRLVLVRRETGTAVGSEVTLVDDGWRPTAGLCPFDDEGTVPAVRRAVPAAS
jgi:predicted Zn-dependent protease